MEYPFSDNLMRWDEASRRYILTEEAIVANGIDIRGRLQSNRAVDATTVINRLLRRTSEMIYGYIHLFNHDNAAQDEIIEKTASLREIIYNALVSQCEYYLLNGDLSRSVDREKRALAIDEVAKEILLTGVPELRGRSILYAGAWR